VLSDGSRIASDVIVVAIGAEPNTDWLASSGLALGNGVECDEYCRAAPGVVAAGDVASWMHAGLRRRLRVEHRTNAIEQAHAAVRALLDHERRPFVPIPYFWSDQYGVKLQMYGVPDSQCEARMISGEETDDRFAIGYFRGEQLQAALTWSMPREAIALRAQLATGGLYAA
jgi:3-phenylpropionate/trans-cinnamate dioxygenase ferredoxin reductase subunit